MPHSSRSTSSDEAFARFHLTQDNCFTLFRYIFAFGIFFNHLYTASGRDIVLCNSDWFVKGFFIISGFLTFNSYVRSAAPAAFFMRRVRRLVPAYVLTILLCFAIGAAVTTLPLREFLVQPATWKYLAANLCFLNFVQPTLPGVFETLAVPVVNAALWTLKIEILFYLTVPLVYWAMRRFGAMRVLTVIVVASLGYEVTTSLLYATTGNPLFHTLSHQLPGMLSYFYFPVMLLFGFSFVQRHERWLTGLSVALLVANYWWPQLEHLKFAPFSLLLVALAYRAEHFVHARRWHDISYDFFLIHFPLIQLSWTLFPSLPLSCRAVLTLLVTTLMAILLQQAFRRLVSAFSHSE